MLLAEGNPAQQGLITGKPADSRLRGMPGHRAILPQGFPIWHEWCNICPYMARISH